MFHPWSTINSEKPVLVIGAACVDIVGRLNTDLRRGTSNPAHIRSSFGGVARNVAENLARLGQPAILLSVVGKDNLGERMLQQADEAGINVEHIFRTTQHPTGTYLAVVNSSGELRFALDDLGGMDDLTPGYLREHTDLFKGASLLFIDANLSKEALRVAITLAKRANLKVCADPTSTTLAEKLKPHLPDISLITPNAAEAAIFCEPCMKVETTQDALAAAKSLVAQGVELAIITLAERGLCYATSETSGHIPAVRTEILDPTGAGDALTATVIFALLNEIPLDDAVRLGVSAASLTLRYQGAVAPDLSLEKLYDQLII